MVVGCALEHDRAVQLAREGRWQLVRTELVGDAELLLGHDEEETQEFGLDRRHGAQDVADRQRLGEADEVLGPVAVLARPTVAAAMRRSRTWRSDALLDAGHLADPLERLVATQRIADLPGWPA